MLKEEHNKTMTHELECPHANRRARGGSVLLDGATDAAGATGRRDWCCWCYWTVLLVLLVLLVDRAHQ